MTARRNRVALGNQEQPAGLLCLVAQCCGAQSMCVWLCSAVHEVLMVPPYVGWSVRFVRCNAVRTFSSLLLEHGLFFPKSHEVWHLCCGTRNIAPCPPWGNRHLTFCRTALLLYHVVLHHHREAKWLLHDTDTYTRLENRSVYYAAAGMVEQLKRANKMDRCVKLV